MSIRDKLGDPPPRVLVRVHFWGIWFWLAVMVAAVFTGWIKSTTFISVLSIVALSLTHWSGYQAARAELHQDEGGR